MTGKDLIMGLNYLDDTLINEAEIKYLKKQKASYLKWCCAAAACLGLVFLTSALLDNTAAVTPDIFAAIPSNDAVWPPSDGLGQDSSGFTDVSPDNSLQTPADGLGQDAIGFASLPTNDVLQNPADDFEQNTPYSTDALSDNTLPNPADNQDVPDNSVPVENASSPSKPLDMAKIYVNDLSDALSADAAKLKFDPALYDEILWNKDDVISYYGKDMIPTYIPASLSSYFGNGTAKAIIKKDGTVVEDTIYLYFYQDYGEDGYPSLNGATIKGIDLTASKTGVLKCGIYIFPEDMKPSEIAGVSVMIGQRSMSYGPYDPETHQPSGYYTLYEADFEYDGIEYEVICHRIELEELIKFVASIITGEDEFEISDL